MAEYTYELHLHSCLSPCGDESMTPNNIAGMAMLNGVRIAALTDHNTVRNCPAFFETCAAVGVVPVAGMELTTAEDIHMVCLFATLAQAQAFGDVVETHRMRVRNRPAIFGEQLVLNAQDEVIDTEEHLLLPATALDIETAAALVRDMGGACFPAHIDKQSNGLIAVLGDFPPSPTFYAAEVHDIAKLPQLRTQYPLLSQLTVVQNSDAHSLEQMNLEPPKLSLLPKNESDQAIRDALIALLRGEDMRNYQQYRQN